jgi:hypothetical protein
LLQKVDRRVDIAVVFGAAGGAAPVAYGKGQVLEPMPAHATELRAGKEPVGYVHVHAVQVGLVRELPAELVKADVADGTGQAVVADHAADVKVLDGYLVEASDQVRRGLVQPVGADAGEPVV